MNTKKQKDREIELHVYSMSEYFKGKPRRFYPDPEYFNGKPIIIEPADQEHVREHLRVKKVCFDKKTATIQFLGENDHWLYEVDLYIARTPEELLHWCFHISHKDWGTPQVVGAILKLVDRVIGETTDTTAEHCYSYRKMDSRGEEENGFDWNMFHRSGYNGNKKEY